MSAQTFYLTIPMLPPSGNSNSVRSHWRGFHTAKKWWQAALVDVIVAEGVPANTGCFVRATVEFTAPTRTRRDADNFELIPRKALGDALQQAGVIEDDTPDEWSWTSGRFNYSKGESATTVILHLLDMHEVAA